MAPDATAVPSGATFPIYASASSLAAEIVGTARERVWPIEQDQRSRTRAGGPNRQMAERFHAIVTDSAPGLTPRTWYGMPAYAQGKDVVLFFQDAGKFKARYSTLGFSDKVALDDGAMWPNSYALSELTPEVEERISALVLRAAG